LLILHQFSRAIILFQIPHSLITSCVAVSYLLDTAYRKVHDMLMAMTTS